MREWSEQEEQEMIERAKAGEPEANYELSLWALARSEEEPEEPRWNRLAAKCLVKAAQAGYGPAQKRMAALLKDSGAPADAPQPDRSPRQPVRQTAKAPEPVSIHEARHAAADKAPTATATARQSSPDRRRVTRRPEPEEEPGAADETFSDDEDYDGPDYDDRTAPDGGRPARGGRGVKIGRIGRGGNGGKGKRGERGETGETDDGDEPRARSKGALFSNWGEAQWRRMEMICVFICAVLLVFIAIMLFTSRRSGGGSQDNPNSAIPPAGEAAPAATDTPAPAGEYPDAATRAAIESAELDIPPMEEDFRDSPTTATVSVNSISLRLRKGPNTSYSEITSMPDGSKVEVFADKNDWSLVRYQADDGPVYGWCSSTYLIIDAAPVAIG